ncbi:co-chaperone GrpE [Campylobacter sputorum subsp. bubulus]|uniref:Protein GrpE n=1 Tax=Campylobacter sputorum subsp. sputorum TaxID=32024 RepID=A0A381DI10_9BACT|nr:nucleotide exchange factor GrpE [Campylobacter sputorum]ASM35297.1 DnaK system nucleotide exchange factor GrpE [Campylobacter sputorum aubsp. sputorum RM3237]ASM36977.1 DnaK system nucleotide exchange factor GrpE [Campylobacter sputorum bv. faecalis CCUG 20703]KAB0582959.1 nucleotide exchange factor GrpE [Campylobacter sputorum subsp. sputorum]QEL05488.1 DnaK system nucleotide exchange factor GrpE [Campylobacter sputorum subsp. sputorum]SUX08694.1 co-chaperone GrpE [Campylobacter sputorum s
MNEEKLERENTQNLDENLNFNDDENISFENLEKEDIKDEQVVENDELAELKAKFIRTVADFENIKKRMEKEKIVAVEFANEGFARDLLPVLDALEMAIKMDVSQNELAKNIKDGVEMTISLFMKNFEKYGITPIKTDSKFNPELHNAINIIEVEGKESGDIVEVYQKGYKYKDRILRPSMVVVVK